MSVELPKNSRSEIAKFIGSGNIAAHKITHPAWTAEIERMCKELGVQKPVLARVPTPFINGVMNTMTGTMILTDGLIKLGGNGSVHEAPSTKNLSVIAHELSHWKYDASKFVTSRLILPAAMPLAAMAALYLYDKANETKKSTETLEQAIQSAASDTHRLIAAAHPDGDDQSKVTRSWKESIIDNGRYLLAGALGFGAALLVARHASLAAEFRADGMAVKLVKDPEAFVGMMKDLHTEGAKVFKAENANHKVPTEMGRRAAYEWKKVMRDLEAYTLSAHPDVDARIAHIRKVGRELGLYDTKTMPSHSHVAALAQGVGAVSHTL